MFKELGSAVFYGLVSSCMTFANKALSQTYNYNFPLFLLVIQMSLMQVALLGLNMIGVTKYPTFTLKGLMMHMPVSFLYCSNAALALASLQATSIPTYGVLKRAAPLFIIIISAAAKCISQYRQKISRTEKQGVTSNGEDALVSVKVTREDSCEEAGKEQLASSSASEASETSAMTVIGVLTIVFGTLLAGSSDLFLSPSALQMAMLSNVTQALYVILVEAKHKGKQGMGGMFHYGKGVDPTLGLLAHNSLLAIPILSFMMYLEWKLRPGADVSYLDKGIYSWGLQFTIAGATLLGCFLNYSMFLCIRNNSALVTSLVGHIKTAAQTGVGFFFLAKDVHASSLYILGVILNAIGGFLFTMGKYQSVQSAVKQFLHAKLGMVGAAKRRLHNV
mmetsp:Transcript_21054/g.70172  ORF Transcript_21054/g.70172 Transcript_21054/m.70172 type:complete len:391 (-) Transcript_21054:104-1276(-)